MDAVEQGRWTGNPLIAALSLILSLFANLSNFFLAGVATRPIAFAGAVYAVRGGRGWTRVVSVVAALLAVEWFTPKEAGRSAHPVLTESGGGDSPQRPPPPDYCRYLGGQMRPLRATGLTSSRWSGRWGTFPR